MTMTATAKKGRVHDLRLHRQLVRVIKAGYPVDTLFDILLILEQAAITYRQKQGQT